MTASSLFLHVSTRVLNDSTSLQFSDGTNTATRRRVASAVGSICPERSPRKHTDVRCGPNRPQLLICAQRPLPNPGGFGGFRNLTSILLGLVTVSPLGVRYVLHSEQTLPPPNHSPQDRLLQPLAPGAAHGAPGARPGWLPRCAPTWTTFPPLRPTLCPQCYLNLCGHDCAAGD
jgi:hypothetical protein